MPLNRKAITVLVVDDSPSMRRVMVASLEDMGFGAIVHAADGLEAWEKVRSEDIGLVICDYKMPKMTGLELLGQIRADSRLKDTPFIIVTSEATRETIKAAMTHKVSGYVVKPFDPDILVQRVDEVIEQSRREA